MSFYVKIKKITFYFRWVNTGYTGSCLDLAEELANQTPVRLDVLLSLTPSAVTSDQLVVPGSIEETKQNDRVARSHSVGSIRDMSNTEAERRILDMVAAGGEAALAPSPTRTITPSESPAQPKRKLETVMSTENAIGIIKKKEKTSDQIVKEPTKLAIHESMDEDVIVESINQSAPVAEQINKDQVQNLNAIEEICNELLNETSSVQQQPVETTIVKPIEDQTSPEKRKVIKKKIIKSDAGSEEKVTKKSPVKTVKKIVSKTKTADLGETLNVLATTSAEKENTANLERKNSLPEESRTTADRRRSRIFETAEKFQSLSTPNSEKQKKIVIPGVSVGNFKKEFERKASLTGLPTATERNLLEKRGSDSSGGGQPSDSRKSSLGETENTCSFAAPQTEEKIINKDLGSPLGGNETGNSSIASFSLEEARKSMENSIALLNQAKTESSKEVDQLCAKTENVAVSDDNNERLKKIKNAREIIGNAIPVGRTCMGMLLFYFVIFLHFYHLMIIIFFNEQLKVYESHQYHLA